MAAQHDKAGRRFDFLTLFVLVALLLVKKLGHPGAAAATKTKRTSLEPVVSMLGVRWASTAMTAVCWLPVVALASAARRQHDGVVVVADSRRRTMIMTTLETGRNE
jgi:hypothetical protein